VDLPVVVDHVDRYVAVPWIDKTFRLIQGCDFI
jgi:hypothetical protein